EPVDESSHVARVSARGALERSRDEIIERVSKRCFDRTRGGLDRRGRSQAVQARESIENPSVHPEGVPGLVLRETHLEEREVAALRSELDVDAVADVVADRVREPAD